MWYIVMILAKRSQTQKLLTTPSVMNAVNQKLKNKVKSKTNAVNQKLLTTQSIMTVSLHRD